VHVPRRSAKAGWPADKVERWPIERLITYAKNARTHSPAQVDQIAASIREWGWTTPVLVSDDAMIIAGHGRVLAARKLRIPDIPVMVATGWTDAQKRAYAIADNKLSLNAGWDRPIENNSSPGQAVYEPFSGSGTTIIAAEITGRSCHAIEIYPSYVDVAVERWEGYTGDTARLEGDGRTFAKWRRSGASRPCSRLYANARPMRKRGGAAMPSRSAQQSVALPSMQGPILPRPGRRRIGFQPVSQLVVLGCKPCQSRSR
jgi:hypothetical protein